jgi:serine/threonine-protein kinase HipA
VALASEVLSQRSRLNVSFSSPHKEQALKEILRVGTSAGGARAKAVIAWNPSTGEVRSGQIPTDEGFEYWIIKFDGVSGNRDRELEDPKGYGAVEYAYHRMALSAGITMNPCRLMEENGRRHFMSRRFDRLENGGKIHMQSLGALAHYDFNLAGAHSYEQALLAIRRLGLGMDALDEQFRRMVFNIVSRNQDDHVKNIAFLMARSGNWSLSPAFDLTYSFNPSGQWTATHQMSVNGKRDGFSMEDLDACAKTASLKRGRAHAILGEVVGAVSRWRVHADEAGVPPAWRDQIQGTLRLKDF